MKFRKFSISTAITATVVVLGIITTFATSAAQNEDENKSVTLSQGNTDISAPHVEWWTYEDYKDWLDNEKIELQEMLGEKGWTGGRGDFIWTQEVIDETIAMYEDILEQIKNGAKISKTVDGSDDIVLMQSTPIDSLNEFNNKEIIDKFGSFGISFDDDKMLYNGEEVRLFFDGTEISDGYVTRYVYYNENGTADITTEYEPTPNADGSNDPFGKFIGLRKATEEEFKSMNFGYNSEEITLESITIADTFEVDKSVEAIITNYADEYTVTEGDFENDGKTLAEIFAPLEKYGVKYDEENNVLYYNEKIVNKFYDLSPDGSVFSFSTDKGGEVCIKTVYNDKGQLSKVEETAFMYESDLRC